MSKTTIEWHPDKSATVTHDDEPKGVSKPKQALKIIQEYVASLDPTVAQYDEDHEAGMKVPKGGSICSKCEYLRDDKKTCRNKFFIAWESPRGDKPAGSDVIPGPIDEYCSDWFHAKDEEK